MAKSLIGLDIGTRFIKFVEMTEEKEACRITGVGLKEIASAEGLKDTVRDLLRDAKIKTRRVVSSVSGRSVIVRYITMPMMSDDELKNAIKYEAAKYIPAEVEEMVLDYQRLPDEKAPGEAAAASPAAPAAEGAAAGAGGGEKAKEMRVLLVAAKHNFIDEHVGLVEGAGLSPAVVDVDSFALGNGFDLVGSVKPDAYDWSKVTALVDIGAAKTNINIVKGAVSYFTREIFIGGDEMTEAISKKGNSDPREAETLKRDPGPQEDKVREAVAQVLDDLCHEIHLSMDYFENQFEVPVDDILVSGGGSLTCGLDEAFEKAFGRKPLHWNPVEHVAFDRERIDPAVLNKYSSQLAVALGLASRIRKK